MTKQELIEKLESEDIPISVFGVDVDPLVVEGKLNLILKYLKGAEGRGTDLMVNGVYQEIINLVEDPQTQLDDLEAYCRALEGTKADNEQLQTVINSLADKTNVGTEKETTLSVSTLQEFQDHFYQLRKLPSRSYQYEVNSSLNLDLMDVLGWPNGNGNQAFIYVDLPYNESGGFEIDITYMERYHNNMYKRTMTSTNNGNWQDTGWVQYASKAEVSNKMGKPSINKISNIFPNSTEQNILYKPQFNGHAIIRFTRDSETASCVLRCQDIDYLRSYSGGDPWNSKTAFICCPLYKGLTYNLFRYSPSRVTIDSSDFYIEEE